MSDVAHDEATPLRALLLAYYFPPHGGAGTQRFAKFVKYLPGCGVSPTVVCAAAGQSLASVPSGDATLCADVPGDVPVYRVPADGRGPSLARRAMLAARFRLDDEAWRARAWPVLCEAAAASDPDVVVTTVSPYANAALGQRLADARGVPHVLDLRDPWALDGWRRYHTRLHAAYDARCMRVALERADLVITSTPAAGRAFVQRLGIDANKVWTIPNGFDDDDFPPRGGSGEHFRLVHVGTLHSTEPAKRRRAHRAIAHEARSGRYLYEAVASLLGSDPGLADTLRIDLYGQVHPTHAALAESLGIAGLVTQHGYVDHDRATQALVDADAVFVPLHDVAAGDEALIVPGKVYEALASGRPLLGCLPKGDAARLVEGLRAGWVCPPRGVPQIEAALRHWLRERRDAGLGPVGTDRAALDAFQRVRLTERLADGLRAVCEPGGLRDSPPADAWRATLTTQLAAAAASPGGVA